VPGMSVTIALSLCKAQTKCFQLLIMSSNL
jgi:hypothetical protein